MRKKLLFFWFGLSLAMIGVAEWNAYRHTARLIGTGDLINQNLETISQLHALESRLLDAESARRGFVITGQSSHLTRFQEATRSTQILLVQLQTLTANHAEQRGQLEQLTILVDQKIARLNRSIGLRQQGLELAAQADLTNNGSALHRNLQRVMAALHLAEEERLSQGYLARTVCTENSCQSFIQRMLLSFGILCLVFGFFYREIRARTQAETVTQRTNQTLKILIEGNHAVIRAADEAGLLGEICRILVEDGGYRLAWVGLAMPGEEKAVRLAAYYGADDGYLATAATTAADTEADRDPAGIAIRTGQPVIMRNLHEEQSLGLWRTEALRRGLASAGAFPLRTDGQSWGVLCLYAGEPGAFDAVEVKLLAELAKDLEYGIKSLKARLEQQWAEQALEQSEAQYRTLVDSLSHGLSMVNREQVITFANPSLCQMLGYSRAELLGHKVFEFFDSENQEIIREHLDQREQGDRTPYEVAWNRKDGEQIIAQITPIPLFDPGGHLQSTVAVITDITDRKRAEAQVRQHLQSLRLLIGGVEKLAKIRDPDVMGEEICRLVVDAFATRLVWLGRIEAGDRVHPLCWAGETATCLNDMEMRLHDAGVSSGPIGEAIETGQPVLINDVSLEKNWTLWGCASLHRGQGALVAFPLMSDQQVFACLNIYADEPNFFTPERVDLLKAFARIAAAAMENARLSLKVEKHLKHLQALHSIDQAISSSLDLDVTLNVLLEHLTIQLQVDAAAVLLLDPRTQTLEFAAGRGFHRDAIRQVRVPLTEGCAGSVAMTQAPVYVPDLTAVRHKCFRAELFASEGFVSYYGVPLHNKGQIRGVIEIFHRRRFNAEEDVLEFLEAMAGQAAIAIDNATLFAEMQQSHQELSLAYGATLEGWARALELRDFETKGHCTRVTDLTLQLARALGVEEQDLPHIYRGALLHDVGKIAVPDAILFKAGPLTPEEWVIMRQHPIYAHELLTPIAYLRPAVDIPFCHHERWDGSGYPMGLKGEDISLAARIFMVVDVWDALGSDRPYRRAWPPDKIKAYLREQAGKQFDPRIVQVFLEKILSQNGTGA
jgi:PAS domain S-box-containing protein